MRPLCGCFLATVAFALGGCGGGEEATPEAATPVPTPAPLAAPTGPATLHHVVIDEWVDIVAGEYWERLDAAEAELEEFIDKHLDRCSAAVAADAEAAQNNPVWWDSGGYCVCDESPCRCGQLHSESAP